MCVAKTPFRVRSVSWHCFLARRVSRSEYVLSPDYATPVHILSILSSRADLIALSNIGHVFLCLDEVIYAWRETRTGFLQMLMVGRPTELTGYGEILAAMGIDG